MSPGLHISAKHRNQCGFDQKPLVVWPLQYCQVARVLMRSEAVEGNLVKVEVVPLSSSYLYHGYRAANDLLIKMREARMGWSPRSRYLGWGGAGLGNLG